MNDSHRPTPVDALLFVAPGCPHCPTVLQGLSELVKSGEIGKLEVVNIAGHPELAEVRGIRSVPWFQLGELEFQGLYSPKELRHWVREAGSEHGFVNYVTHLLESGELATLEALIRRHPEWLNRLIPIVADMEAPINARVGIGALFETLGDEGLLQAVVPDLIALTEHADPRVRGDACHYLGLSRAPEARAALQRCGKDDDADVREIAEEALGELPTAH
jgi:hypothetical protein